MEHFGYDKSKKYIEIIYDQIPKALSIGISLNEFWTLNPRELSWYIEGFKLQNNMIQEFIWLTGVYVKSAVASCLVKNVKYPKAPSKLKEESNRFNEDGSMKDEYIKQSLQDYFNKFGGEMNG